MPRYVAFLRAINVGGRTVKMDRLRQAFEAMGLENVATFIASGNVLFDATSRSTAPLERRIASALHDTLGFEVQTFLRTPAQLSAITQRRPFGATDVDGALYVGFLHEPPGTKARAAVAALQLDADRFEVDGRELYWWARGGMGRSPISPAKLEKALGAPMTLRSITTVRRLAEREA